MDDIRLTDLPDDMRDLAELIGLDAFVRLVSRFGGCQIYIPKLDSVRRRARDREIYASRMKKTYTEMAREYNLTETAVRDIIRRVREENKPQPKQLSLF